VKEKWNSFAGRCQRRQRG